METRFEWSEKCRQYKPKGGVIMSDQNEVKQEKAGYQLTRKSGRVDTIHFTGKREEILNMIKGGATNEEVVAAGFSKNTVLVVRWQAKKVGLLA